MRYATFGPVPEYWTRKSVDASGETASKDHMPCREIILLTARLRVLTTANSRMSNELRTSLRPSADRPPVVPS